MLEVIEYAVFYTEREVHSYNVFERELEDVLKMRTGIMAAENGSAQQVGLPFR